jgi:hypothetical protein
MCTQWHRNSRAGNLEVRQVSEKTFWKVENSIRTAWAAKTKVNKAFHT